MVYSFPAPWRTTNSEQFLISSAPANLFCTKFIIHMVVGETEGESQPRCCMFMLDGRIIGKYDEAKICV